MITRKVLQIILSNVSDGKMSVDDAAEVIMECAGNRQRVPAEPMNPLRYDDGIVRCVPGKPFTSAEGELKLEKTRERWRD